MKTKLALLVTLLAVNCTMADPYVIAKQRARDTSAKNDAEQQRIQNAANGQAPTYSTPGAAAAATDPALQATLKNLSDLSADFTALGGTAKPDATQKISLLNNLTQAAAGKKATTDSVKSLAQDLTTALSGKSKITPAQQKQLAGIVHAAFNGTHLSDAQSTKAFTAASKILTDAGATLDEATNVVTDLKQIATETK
jgi:hypothetical protein